MFRHVHTLSAVLFYLLGTSFFLAFVLMHNGIAASMMLAWLRIADMPLLLAGLAYGGMSVYDGIRTDGSSKAQMLGVILPLVIIFLLLIALNFGSIGA